MYLLEMFVFSGRGNASVQLRGKYEGLKNVAAARSRLLGRWEAELNLFLSLLPLSVVEVSLFSPPHFFSRVSWLTRPLHSS